jgi:hypothetical protein
VGLEYDYTSRLFFSFLLFLDWTDCRDEAMYCIAEAVSVRKFSFNLLYQIRTGNC